MARIKERDHHWEDGMKVSCLYAITPVLSSTHLQVVEHIMHISRYELLKPNYISSGSPRLRRPGHHLRGLTSMSSRAPEDGMPSEFIVVAEACYV
jgi:hypothetical protein